jgi:hypothetical protein
MRRLAPEMKAALPRIRKAGFERVAIRTRPEFVFSASTRSLAALHKQRPTAVSSAAVAMSTE